MSLQSLSHVRLFGLQHTRLPCPSPCPRVCSKSCPSSCWCHPTISSSVIPFTCLQTFSASGSFSMSQHFTSDGQRTGVSASASILPMKIQDWFPLGLTGLISLQSKDSHESSPIPQFKRINSLALNFIYNPTLTSMHDYWKTIALTSYQGSPVKNLPAMWETPVWFLGGEDPLEKG